MAKNGVVWQFTYDANGMRTSHSGIMSIGTNINYTYTYTGGQLTHMTYNGIGLHFYYDAAGRPLSVIYGGATYYYVTNLQGEVVAILDSIGAAVVEYTYDAWGRPLTTTGSMAYSLGLYNPLRYRGYVYDRETGLYYLQSRYYNPTWGRFLNADAFVSTGQGLLGNNMFAYCNNNSVNFTDPRGDVAVSTDSFWGWVGGKIGIWFAELITGNHYETGDCINPIAVDAVETAVDIGTAFVNNAEISGGFGLGLAGEAVLLDYIRISGGVAYDVFHITLTPNNIRIRERSQIGFDASYSVLELGSSEQQFRDYSNNYPNEFYNDDSTKSVIFGTGRYFFMGGSFQISLDVECFCNEVLQVLMR